MNRAVFFDRDGIIVKNINGVAPKKSNDLELILEAISVIKKLQRRKYKVVIISNQPDIALGKINENTKEEIQKGFEILLKKKGISANIYYCFHHPQGIVKKYSQDCNCRKPKIGMFVQAIDDHKIDPLKSYIVGDRATDVKAGILVGIKTILFDPINFEQDYLLRYQVKPDFMIKKLSDIMGIIK